MQSPLAFVSQVFREPLSPDRIGQGISPADPYLCHRLPEGPPSLDYCLPYHTSEETACISLDEIRSVCSGAILCGRWIARGLDIQLSATTRDQAGCGVVRRVRGGESREGSFRWRNGVFWQALSEESPFCLVELLCRHTAGGYSLSVSGSLQERGRAKERRTAATCTFALPRIAGGTPK